MRPSAGFGDAGDAGKEADGSDLDGLLLAACILDGLMAAGGNANGSEASTDALSLTMNSPDMAGVGGRRERDMAFVEVKRSKSTR